MIDSFRGHYSFLSNFYYASQIINGVVYPTNEHFFQACKTLILDEQIAIINAPKPGIAKQMANPRGYKLPNGAIFKITIRQDWEDIRIGVMNMGIEAKFSQNIPLHNELMLTQGTNLCEGNWWHDNFWGDCRCPKCLGSPGLNMLGRLLMAYRSRFV